MPRKSNGELRRRYVLACPECNQCVFLAECVRRGIVLYQWRGCAWRVVRGDRSCAGLL